MNPSSKKLKDNHIKISVDHYDYQILQAHAEKSGVELATLVRELTMSKLHELMFNEQPIAMLLPSQNKVELPLTHFLAMQQPPHNNGNQSNSQGGVYAP